MRWQPHRQIHLFRELRNLATHSESKLCDELTAVECWTCRIPTISGEMSGSAEEDAIMSGDGEYCFVGLARMGDSFAGDCGTTEICQQPRGRNGIDKPHSAGSMRGAPHLRPCCLGLHLRISALAVASRAVLDEKVRA